MVNNANSAMMKVIGLALTYDGLQPGLNHSFELVVRLPYRRRQRQAE